MSRKSPLWLHKSTGQWCKKLRQVNYYFGTDEAIALKRYRDEWDDIVAGKKATFDSPAAEPGPALEPTFPPERPQTPL